MTLTPEQERYHLIGNAHDVLLECIKISHPAFSQDYLYVRNHTKGVTVTHEDGAATRYEYAPLKLQRGKSNEKLSQEITVTVADLGMIIPQEIDRLYNSPYELEYPLLTYRSYLLSNLDAPYETARNLKIIDNTPQTHGAMFKAVQRQLNDKKSGRAFILDKWRALRGFLNA